MPRISKLVCGRVKTCTQIIHLPGLNHYARLLILEYANSGVEFNMFEFPIYLKFFKEVESTTVLTCIDCTSYSTLPRGVCFEGRILENLSASNITGHGNKTFRRTGCPLYCTRLTACITLPLPGINLAFHITRQAFYLLLLKLIICLRTLG